MSRGKSGSVFARLSSKILLAMGSVLFLFALVLGLYYYIVTMPQATALSPASPQGSLLAQQMKVSLQEAQKNEGLFLLNPSPELVSSHKAAVAQLLSLSSQFAKSAQQTGNKKSAATAGKITSSAQQLDAAFFELVQARETKGFNGSPGLLEKLANAGQQLQKIISRNEAGSLALAFLRIQQHEQEYLKTSSSIELRNLQAAIKNFTQILTAARIEPVEAQVLNKAIKEYNAALDRYQAVSLATDDRKLSATLSFEQKRQSSSMRSGANNIKAVISRVNVPDALLMMLLIRQHESLYLLSGDVQYAQQLNSDLDALIALYNSSSILQEHKNQFLKASTIYRDTFTSLVEQDTVIKNQLATLNEITTSLAGLIDNAVKASSPTSSATAPPFTATGNNLAMIAAIAGIAVILIGFLVAVLLGKSISTPIVNMADTVRQITTDKDFNVQIPVSSNNELGVLAQELNALLQQQENTFHHANNETSGRSQNLNILTDIAHDLRRQIKAVGEVSSNMRTSTASQDELANNVTDSVTRLSATADAINQLFSQSDEQNQLITEAVENIGKSIESTVESIKGITQSSSQISDIITLSTEIAEQTNLLALNASVKAARAGSHGKEFAVIADEIAKLAQRSEEMAKEAGQLTVNLNSKVNDAIQLGDESTKSLNQVQEAGRLNLLAAEKVADQAATINISTGELSKLVKGLADTFSDIDSMAREQGSECAAALESIENLLKKYGLEEGLADTDASLKQAVDTIAITGEQEEEDNEFGVGQADESATKAAVVEDRIEDHQDTGSAIVEADKTKETVIK